MTVRIGVHAAARDGQEVADAKIARELDRDHVVRGHEIGGAGATHDQAGRCASLRYPAGHSGFGPDEAEIIEARVNLGDADTGCVDLDGQYPHDKYGDALGR